MINIYDIVKNQIPAKNHKYIKLVEDDEQGVTVRFLKPGHTTKKTKLGVKKDYFRVVTGENEGRAEMFLYGFIGQDFWWDEELKEESITDLAFIRAFRELEKNYDRIDIRINSPGGSVMHGDPIIAAIRNSKKEIHTYNDGIAASMAFDIWMAGHERHMSANSKAMIHSTWSVAIGNAKDMRAAAGQLDKFDDAAILTFSKATGWTEEEIRERFYDHEDHWLTAKDLEEMGIISKVEDYQTESPEEEPEKATYQGLVKVFTGVIENKEQQPEDKRETDDTDLNTATIDMDGDVEGQLKALFGENFSITANPAEEIEEDSTILDLDPDGDFFKTDTEDFLKKIKLQAV